ncbi:MAG TPA: response regulator [Candidatus Limnocylindria bacterium]|nr:response regulator [Candidatus Limnocylindria bacterium]
MTEPAKILAVDDVPQNLRLLEAVLAPQGYTVVTAATGEDALLKVLTEKPDLVLLDIMLPGIDGYEVCRRVRADPATQFLPIVMVTASDLPEKKKAVEAGADDFLPKPWDQTELLTRVRSLLRVKRYHDTVERQRGELEHWNQTLEARVRDQVDELARLGRLRHFLSPQIAEMVTSQGAESALEPHRREITVAFCDLRGYTAFTDTSEPEEALAVLRTYHAAMGELVFRHEGTLEHFAGDGFMTFFNDPITQEDAPLRAVRMAVAMRERFGEISRPWKKKGYTLGFGVGISLGYATLGRIGFEGRFDYGAVGAVTNLGARLAGQAKDGQIVISQRVHAAVEDQVECERLPDLELKGLTRPIPAFNVIALKERAPA